MNFLQEVHADRKRLADVLRDKEYSGMRGIVEDLYPDRAHFIYELLQNAEDAHATEASFILYTDRLIFQHNGKPFSEEDVRAITNIGKGTKRGKEDTIGSFGVGFKSVFAYSETPSIRSPTYSFQICDLVLPEEITYLPGLNGQTQFEFPFNNPKKTISAAFKDIKQGLEELSQTTLLFLTHLQLISWKLGENVSNVLRINHSDYHLEILKEVGKKTTESHHLLKFIAPVQGLENQNVAVAFELDFLPDIDRFEDSIPIAKQLRITSASPGRVSIFFPAEKETSGLRFHLHAPFITELSRSSVKESSSNSPLFHQIAKLAASSLHKIRDLGLLTREMLAVLPNQSDQIPEPYQYVRKVIVKEMKRRKLTPVHSGNGHAPASLMLQAKASLKNLLTQEDLMFFHGEKRHWAVSATQRNNEVDRFLQQLDLDKWDTEDFLENIDTALRYYNANNCHYDKDEFWHFLSSKSLEWHQQFYAVLWELKLHPHPAENIPIVRLTNEKYKSGKECFFPGDMQIDNDPMPRVDEGVYTSGKNKTQQEDARKLLEVIGVREVGEPEQIEAILQKRYSNTTDHTLIKANLGIKCSEAEIQGKVYLKDLRRFIKFIKENPERADLFQDYFIFKCEKEQWCKPTDVYLDKPFKDTGLSSYYMPQGDDAQMFPLSVEYQKWGISSMKLSEFAEKTGVQVALKPIRTQVSDHPNKYELMTDHWKGGARRTYTEIDDDWTIPKLSDALKHNSERLSLLIWNTMCNAEPDTLKAQYRPNQQYPTQEAPSSLVLLLQETEWIPQGKGRFMKPSQSSRDFLPSGFVFDSGFQWLKSIKFESEIAKYEEEQQQKRAVAKKLGFEDDYSLELAQQFSQIPVEIRERLIRDYKEKEKFELPEHEPSDRNRRRQHIKEIGENAFSRETETRDRSISVNRNAVKEEARQYLKEQYTNPDGEMICQACRKPLPFKLDNGTSYFECVEFLDNIDKHHFQNYLALCPNHAAMFKHANGSRDELMSIVIQTCTNELDLVLAQRTTRVYFTKIHLFDLQTLIQTEEKNNNCGDGSDE